MFGQRDHQRVAMNLFYGGPRTLATMSDHLDIPEERLESILSDLVDRRFAVRMASSKRDHDLWTLTVRGHQELRRVDI